MPNVLFVENELSLTRRTLEVEAVTPRHWLYAADDSVQSTLGM
jgi:hypothetical protein